MAVWPYQFCALMNSYQENPPDNVIRSSMDKGPDKVRRRTTASVRPISFKMLLSPYNLQVLDDFYNIDTLGGSEPFDFIHPRTKQAVKARFTGIAYNDKSGKYEAAIGLEILP